MKKWVTRGLLLAGALSLVGAAYGAAAALSGANSAKAESVMGDLVADGVKAAAKAEIALVPADSLTEKVIPLTAATPEAIRPALSTPSEGVVTVKVTGKQLLGALERSLILAPRKNQGFLQVSGLTLVYDAGRPEGSRVAEVKVNDEPLKLDKAYVVAMPESLSKGALGYFKFWDAKDAKPLKNGSAKVTLLDALMERFKSGKTDVSGNRIVSR